jgi:fructose-bisphosphate aldolase class 1
MRSIINLPSKASIAAVVAQQFEAAAQIAENGLIPIIEPEVSIKSPDKAGAQAILLAELTRELDAMVRAHHIGRRSSICAAPPVIKTEPSFYYKIKPETGLLDVSSGSL